MRLGGCALADGQHHRRADRPRPAADQRVARDGLMVEMYDYAKGKGLSDGGGSSAS